MNSQRPHREHVDNGFDAASLTPEVLIVGLGPVGKVIAIQLGQQGHRVLVVDRNAASYPLPRAVTHCADVARILQSIGLSPDTIPHITEPFDDMYRWRSGDGNVLMEVDWSGRGESGWHNTYFFHQPDLEDALDELLAALPSVQIIRRCQAVSVTQQHDGATVVLESTTDGERRAVTADWVVGADGANSTIRQAADIEWHDEGYFSDWLVIDVKLRNAGVTFPRVAVQHCDPTRPATMVPGGPARRRWEFMRLPDETCAELDSAERAWELLARWGIGPDSAELERHSVYTFRAGWAARWRTGRVLLAGDAAHLMPPFAGQGLGAGLRDAANLSWKLSAVLRGVAGEQLLETYEGERQHHAAAFVEFSTTLGRVVCITDPHAAATRDLRLTSQRHAGTGPSAPPRPTLGPGLHLGTHGGALARQGRIRVAGSDQTGLFDDIFRGAGAVVTRTAQTLDDLEPQLYTALAALHITVTALSGTPNGVNVFHDIDGVYRRWLDELDVDTVVVRPDFHLFGSTRARGTVELIRAFVAAVGAPTPVPSRVCTHPKQRG